MILILIPINHDPDPDPDPDPDADPDPDPDSDPEREISLQRSLAYNVAATALWHCSKDTQHGTSRVTRTGGLPAGASAVAGR